VNLHLYIATLYILVFPGGFWYERLKQNKMGQFTEIIDEKIFCRYKKQMEVKLGLG